MNRFDDEPMGLPGAGSCGFGCLGILVLPLLLLMGSLTSCKTATVKLSLGFQGVTAGVEIDPFPRHRVPPEPVKPINAK